MILGRNMHKKNKRGKLLNLAPDKFILKVFLNRLMNIAYPLPQMSA